MASKRKRNVVTLEKKLDIIEELKKGKSQRLVAEIHSIPKSTRLQIFGRAERR